MCYYGCVRLTMVSERCIIMGVWDLLWWAKADVLLWVWETYYGEGKEMCYYGCGRLTMVKEGRCVIMGVGDLLWWAKGGVLLWVVETYYGEWREMYYNGWWRFTVVSEGRCIVMGGLLWWKKGDVLWVVEGKRHVLIWVGETHYGGGEGRCFMDGHWRKFPMEREDKCINMGWGNLLWWGKDMLLLVV